MHESAMYFLEKGNMYKMTSMSNMDTAETGPDVALRSLERS